MNQAFVRSGMMFAAVPPSWMIPWTRASGWSCWRHRPTELNSRIIASSAFLPFHGSEAAWACRPWNTTSTSSDASGWLSTWLRSQGWNSRAASIPSKRPSSIMMALPLPRSSAGVPRNTISPGSSSAIEASAIAAPTPDAAIVLWPQPWPRPGRASYSARIPIRGPAPPRPPAEDSAHGGRQPAGRMLDRVAVAGDRLGHPCRGMLLLERHLRDARGSGATAGRSRPDALRRPRRAAPSSRRTAEPAGGRSGSRNLPVARGTRSGRVTPHACGPCQRSADSVISATTMSASMNSTIGSARTPSRRSSTRTVTNRPAQAPRRAARVQSPL